MPKIFPSDFLFCQVRLTAVDRTEDYALAEDRADPITITSFAQATPPSLPTMPEFPDMEEFLREAMRSFEEEIRSLEEEVRSLERYGR